MRQGFQRDVFVIERTKDSVVQRLGTVDFEAIRYVDCSEDRLDDICNRLKTNQQDCRWSQQYRPWVGRPLTSTVRAYDLLSQRGRILLAGSPPAPERIYRLLS